MNGSTEPMSEAHSRYPVAIRWTSGKEGVASSVDGLPELPVASPPSFGGPAGVWSPEHLFVLSAAACWMTTFRAIAEASSLDVVAVEADAEGFLEKGVDRRYSIPRLTLRPVVTVRREADRDKAMRLIEKAEQACLIARSMRAAVTLEGRVEVLEA